MPWAPLRPCLDCGSLTGRSRCPACSRRHDRQVDKRRLPPDVRYGPGRKGRHREVIMAEPWCHYPGGCAYRIEAGNPLTAQHVVPVSRGGVAGPLTVLCRRHNSHIGGGGQ